MFALVQQLVAPVVVAWWAMGSLKRLPSTVNFPFLPLVLLSVSAPLQSWVFESQDVSPGVQAQVRLSTLVSGGFLLLWAVCVIISLLIARGELRIPRLSFYEKLVLLFLPLSVFSTLVGLVMDNSLDYIISDTYKFAFFSIIYLATVLAVRPKNAMSFSKALLQLILIVFLIGVTVQVVNTVINGPQRGGATGIVFFLLPYFLSVEASGGRDPVFHTSRWVRMLIIIAMLISVYLSFTRMYWLVSLFEILLCLIMVRKPIRTHASIAFTFTVILVGIVALMWISSSLLPSAYREIDFMRQARVQEFWAGFDEVSAGLTGERKPTHSLSEKTSEGHDVLEHMKENGDAINYLVGFGNGAEYRATTGNITSRVVSSKGPDFNHNIHNIFYGVLFRQGILGVLFVGLFFAALLYGLYKAWRRVQGASKIIVGAFLLGSWAYVINQLSIVGMFWDPLYVVGLAFIGQLIRFEVSNRVAGAATPAGNQVTSP